MPFPFTFIIIAGLYTALGLGTYFTTKPKENPNPPVPTESIVVDFFGTGSLGAPTAPSFLLTNVYNPTEFSGSTLTFRLTNVVNVNNIQNISFNYFNAAPSITPTLVSVQSQTGSIINATLVNIEKGFNVIVRKPQLASGVTEIFITVSFSIPFLSSYLENVIVTNVYATSADFDEAAIGTYPPLSTINNITLTEYTDVTSLLVLCSNFIGIDRASQFIYTSASGDYTNAMTYAIQDDVTPMVSSTSIGPVNVVTNAFAFSTPRTSISFILDLTDATTKYTSSSNSSVALNNQPGISNVQIDFNGDALATTENFSRVNGTASESFSGDSISFQITNVSGLQYLQTITFLSGSYDFSGCTVTVTSPSSVASIVNSTVGTFQFTIDNGNFSSLPIPTDFFVNIVFPTPFSDTDLSGVSLENCLEILVDCTGLNLYQSPPNNSVAPAFPAAFSISSFTDVSFFFFQLRDLPNDVVGPPPYGYEQVYSVWFVTNGLNLAATLSYVYNESNTLVASSSFLNGISTYVVTRTGPTFATTGPFSVFFNFKNSVANKIDSTNFNGLLLVNYVPS